MVVLRTGLCLLLALYHVTMIAGAVGVPAAAGNSCWTAEEPDSKGRAADSTEAPAVPKLTAASQTGKRTLLPAAVHATGCSTSPRTAITSERCRHPQAPTATTTLYLDHCALLC